MTSANVIDYTIRRLGTVVGAYHQHLLCKYSHHELLKYQPEEEFTIQACWIDEDEAPHWKKELPLAAFLQPFQGMGQRYRDGCTIEEVYTAPKGKWGLPDLGAVKANRKPPA